MLQGGPYTKLGRNLLLILFFGLAIPPRPELLDCIDGAAILGTGLDETDSATCTRTKNTAPLAILFSEVCLSGFGEGRRMERLIMLIGVTVVETAQSHAQERRRASTRDGSGMGSRRIEMG